MISISDQRPQGSYISHFSNMVKAHGGINLAQGIPGYQPPAALLDALQARLRDDVHQYAPGQGNRKLLELVAQRHALQPANVLMVQGGTEGLSLVYTYIAQRMEADMAVMAIEPAYEVHSNLPRIYGHRYVAFSPSADGSLNLDLLARTVAEQRVRLLFVASPGNPYGRALSKNEVEQLLQLAQQLGFYLVFDAAYHELYFAANSPYLPTDSLTERLFVVGSFSKSLCITGWRVGYVLHHASHGDALRAVHDYVGLCASSVMQCALADYLPQADAAHFVATMRQKLSRTHTAMASALQRLGFVVPPADGGCFVWAQLPQRIAADGFGLAIELYRQQQVAIVPGEHFGAAHTRWIRLNIARPASEVDEAIRRLNLFMQ